MADRYSNPFQSVEVLVPTDVHHEFERFCRKGNAGHFDRSPFPRMVDLWFLSVCIAAKLGLEPSDIQEVEKRKIIDGSIFSSDPWRVDVLMLIAIAVTGKADIVAEPRKMMAVANGLAVAGLREVVEMLSTGQAEEIWNLSDCVSTILEHGDDNT